MPYSLTKYFLALPLLTVILASQITSASVLAGWDVNGIDLDGPSAPNSAPYTYSASLGSNISAADLTLSSAVNRSTTSSKYGFKVAGGNEQATLAGAISAGHYFQFTITAAPNFLMNLTSIEMNGESTGNGADQAAFFSSAAGFTAGAELASVIGKRGVTGGFDTDASGFGAPIDLSGSAYQGVSSATFRFYAWDTVSGTGSTRIRDLTGSDLIINGTVTAVPEPSAMVLGLLGFLSLLKRKR